MNHSRVTLYSFSFSHHGKYSSFHRLLNYVRNLRTLDVTFPFRSLLGEAWSRRLEARWQRASEWRLRSIFARRERQCVHYLYPENSLFRAADWKRHHALVLSCHQPAAYLQRMKTKNYEGFFRGLAVADRVVLLSEHFKAGYAEICDPKRLVVIPHGVDANFFHQVNERKEPLVITIGNWLRDYDFWAETAIRLASEIPDTRFAVVAMPSYVGAAKERAEDALGKRVQFLQGLSDDELKRLYQRATVLFLPLKDAGANNALLESMASGLPNVVSDLPATREYAGNCGNFFQQGNVDEAVFKLREILTNGSQWNGWSAACRKRVEEYLSWEVIAESYARLYSDVLENR